MIYFFIYLFVEVLVSVQIAGYLGGIGTFLEIMLSGFIGIVLLANVKTTMMESFKAMSNNCISMKEFQELNIFALLGAVLLILPGLLSDIIGVLMQFSVFPGHEADWSLVQVSLTDITARKKAEAKKKAEEEAAAEEETSDES